MLSLPSSFSKPNYSTHTSIPKAKFSTAKIFVPLSHSPEGYAWILFPAIVSVIPSVHALRIGKQFKR